jgi:tRNA(fMet)-specific endonuclease VapC
VSRLFDTDVISAAFRPRRHPALPHRFAKVPDDEQFMSAISYAELLYGALRRGRQELLGEIHRLARRMRVLPFDQVAAERFADLKADLERLGTPIAEADLRIAATALVNGLILVTGNERHFRRVPGLAIENWLLPEVP